MRFRIQKFNFNGTLSPDPMLVFAPGHDAFSDRTQDEGHGQSFKLSKPTSNVRASWTLEFSNRCV